MAVVVAFPATISGIVIFVFISPFTVTFAVVLDLLYNSSPAKAIFAV